MKDRKTLLIFLLPLLFFLLAVVGTLLIREIRESPDPSVQIRAEAETWDRKDHPLDLNTATLEELCSLPNIGQTTAQRIIDYRDTHGLFRSVEELMWIDGFKSDIFKEIRDYVCVEE